MTEFQIEVNLAHVPEGTPVELYGLGSFPNGGTYDVPDELVQLFRINHPATGLNDKGDAINVDPMEQLAPQIGIQFFRTDSVSTSDTDETDETDKGESSPESEVETTSSAPVDLVETSGSANAPTDTEEGSK